MNCSPSARATQYPEMTLSLTICTLILCSMLLGCSVIPNIDVRSQYLSMWSEAMDKEMDYSVYTPPGWTLGERLPLVLLLHGRKDDHTTFDRYQVGRYLDNLYLNNELPRVLIVSPNGDNGFWENWDDGSYHYQDWIVKDLLPAVREQFDTLPCPEHCYVTGMSMGAHGAMKLAMNEPALFSSIAAISGVIISRSTPPNALQKMLVRLYIPIERIWGEADAKLSREKQLRTDPYYAWTENTALQDTRLFLSWGDRERRSIQTSNTRFHKYLKQHTRKHAAYVYEGRHLWADWKKPIAESLRFHVIKPEDEQASISTTF